MNQTGRRDSKRRNSKCGYLKHLSIAMLAGAFLMSTEMPLLASTPQSSQSVQSSDSGQSSQSSPANQKQNDALPDAPQSQSTPTPPGQQPAPAPSGAAGAKAANVKGAPVAEPTGAAVAPARQRGHRSLLVKVGLVAGGAIAIGTVVALSQGKSQTRPPGAASATNP